MMMIMAMIFKCMGGSLMFECIGQSLIFEYLGSIYLLFVPNYLF